MRPPALLRFFLGMAVLWACGLPGLVPTAHAVTVRMESVTGPLNGTATVRVFLDASDREVGSTGVTDVQGWTLSVRIPGSSVLGLEVRAARTSDYVMSLMVSGFEFTEPAQDPATSDEGFVSGIVLSYGDEVRLPVGEHEVADFDVYVPCDMPVGAVMPMIFFDGMQGSGVPISNIFVAAGMSYEYQILDIGLLSIAPASVSVRIEDVRVEPGGTVTAKVFMDATAREVGDTGVTDIQGWSLSAKVPGSVGLGIRVQAARTSDYVLSLLVNGFNSTQPALDPATSDKGLVTAIVLSMSEDVRLPVGEHEVAEFDVSVPSTVPIGSAIPVVFFDGMQGSGAPVPNIFTASSSSCIPGPLLAGTITVVPPSGAVASLAHMISYLLQ